MKTLFKYLLTLSLVFALTGCDDFRDTDSDNDREGTIAVGDKLVENQPTPTDIEYSLERYNLIKRAYWVNGMRDKANSLPCPIADMPVGYVVLFSQTGEVIGQFTVQGKVSSLNSYLTPDSEYYEKDTAFKSGFDNYATVRGADKFSNKWIPDVDGTYGSNDTGIFFFTVNGQYVEWDSTYLYSDIPFSIESTVLGEY